MTHTQPWLASFLALAGLYDIMTTVSLPFWGHFQSLTSHLALPRPLSSGSCAALWCIYDLHLILCPDKHQQEAGGHSISPPTSLFPLPHGVLIFFPVTSVMLYSDVSKLLSLWHNMAIHRDHMLETHNRSFACFNS